MIQEIKCRGCHKQIKGAVVWMYFPKLQSWHQACYRCGTIVRRLSQDCYEKSADYSKKKKCLTKQQDLDIIKKSNNRRVYDEYIFTS